MARLPGTKPCSFLCHHRRKELSWSGSQVRTPRPREALLSEGEWGAGTWSSAAPPQGFASPAGHRPHGDGVDMSTALQQVGPGASIEHHCTHQARPGDRVRSTLGQSPCCKASWSPVPRPHHSPTTHRPSAPSSHPPTEMPFPHLQCGPPS